jgi:hypothetical protein
MNTLTPSLSCPIASITTDANGAISALANNTTPSVSSITYPDSTVQTTALATISTSVITASFSPGSLGLNSSGTSSFQNFAYNYTGISNLLGAFTYNTLTLNCQWTLSLYNGGSGTLIISYPFTGCIINWGAQINVPTGGYVFFKISQKRFNNTTFPYIEVTYPLY